MEKIASVSNDASSVYGDSKASSTRFSSSDLALNSAVSAAYDGGKSVEAKNDGDGDGDGSALPSNCSNKLVNVNITSKTELNNYTRAPLQLQSSSSSTQESDRIFVSGGGGDADDKGENVNADVSIITADEGQKSKADLISGEQQPLKITMEVAAAGGGGGDEKESSKTENRNELSLAEKSSPPPRSRPHPPPPLKSLPLLKIDPDANLAVMERDISTSSSSSTSGGSSQPLSLDRPGELKNRFDSGFSHFPPVTTTTNTTTTMGNNRRNIRRQSLPSTLPPLPPAASSSIGLPQSSPLASPPGPRDGDHPHHRHHHHHHHHHLHHPLSHNKPTTTSSAVASNPLQKSLEKSLLIASRAAYGSLNSDVSAASSSVSSVESLLEIRRENPEEILMALGFGGSGGGSGCGGYGSGLLVDPGNVLLMDPLLRIPGRFFEQPSSARGIDVQDLFTGRRGGLGGSGVGGGRMSPLSVLGSQSTAAGHHHHHHHQGDTRVFHFPQRMILLFSAQLPKNIHLFSSQPGQPTIGEGGQQFYYPYYPHNSSGFYHREPPPPPPEIGISVADSLERSKNRKNKKKNKKSPCSRAPETTPTSPKLVVAPRGPKKHPKVLVMGPKCYHFEPDDVDLYSPKSSSINELTDDQASGPPFSFLLSPRRSSVSLSGGGGGRRSRSPSIVRISPAASVSITTAAADDDDDFNETAAAAAVAAEDHEKEDESDESEDEDDNDEEEKSVVSRRNRASALSKGRSTHLLSVPGHYYPAQMGGSCPSATGYRKLSCPNLELVYKSSNSNSNSNSNSSPVNSADNLSSTTDRANGAQSAASTIVPGGRAKKMMTEKDVSDNNSADDSSEHEHEHDDDEYEEEEEDEEEDDCEQDHNLPTHSPRTHRSASVDIRRSTITFYPPTLNESLAERLKPLLAELSRSNSPSEEQNFQQKRGRTSVVSPQIKISSSSRRTSAAAAAAERCQPHVHHHQHQHQQQQQQSYYHHLSAFIETALVTTIESLKLSLDFYRYFTLQEHSPINAPPVHLSAEPQTSFSNTKKQFGKEQSNQALQGNTEKKKRKKRKKLSFFDRATPSMISTPSETASSSTSSSSTSSSPLSSSPTSSTHDNEKICSSLMFNCEAVAEQKSVPIATTTTTTTTSRGRSRSLVALERDRQSLRLQNLYLDVLDVETTLHRCLDRFKRETASNFESSASCAPQMPCTSTATSAWTIWQQPDTVERYLGQLEEAVDKVRE